MNSQRKDLISPEDTLPQPSPLPLSSHAKPVDSFSHALELENQRLADRIEMLESKATCSSE